MPLKGKTYLITGGIGQLGREVVQKFLAAHASVVVNYRAANSFEALRQATQQSPNLLGIREDLSQNSGVNHLFEQIGTEFRRLDGLIHLAGSFWAGVPVAHTPLEKWQEMLNANLLTTFLCCRRAMQIFENQKFGRIFAMGAAAAMKHPAKMGAYAVSKVGVAALIEVIAKEAKPFGVSAHAILPTIIDTPQNRRAMPGADYAEWVKPEAIADVMLNICKGGSGETLIRMGGKKDEA